MATANIVDTDLFAKELKLWKNIQSYTHYMDYFERKNKHKYCSKYSDEINYWMHKIQQWQQELSGLQMELYNRLLSLKYTPDMIRVQKRERGYAIRRELKFTSLPKYVEPYRKKAIGKRRKKEQN